MGGQLDSWIVCVGVSGTESGVSVAGVGDTLADILLHSWELSNLGKR